MASGAWQWPVAEAEAVGTGVWEHLGACRKSRTRYPQTSVASLSAKVSMGGST